jgi:hypothetical protein
MASSTLTPAERTHLAQQVRRELKPALEDFVREEVARQLGGRAAKAQVQEISLDVLFKFYRQLANRSAFFKNV